MNIPATKNSALRIAGFFLGVLALLTTWFLVYFLIAAYVEGLLAPWDVTEVGEPLPGTLPRRVNDFFEGPPGDFLASRLTVLLGALLLSRRLVRERTPWALWQVAAANVVFLGGSFLLGWVGGSLEVARRQQLSLLLTAPGFHLWAIAGVGVSWLGLLYLYAKGSGGTQKRLTRRR